MKGGIFDDCITIYFNKIPSCFYQMKNKKEREDMKMDIKSDTLTIEISLLKNREKFVRYHKCLQKLSQKSRYKRRRKK